MQRFPYITEYINELFSREKTQWDFILLRPILLVSYFFVRSISFPLKFVLHRVPYGFEPYLIDKSMALGMKYLARYEAAELLLRHVQIEPLLYRHILSQPGVTPTETPRKLNGIYGDFGVEDLATVVNNSMTIGHDLLSYEVIDRFDKSAFLNHLDYIRSLRPEDHEQLSKAALEENRKHSWQLLGATNIVMLIVMTITLFGDLRTTIKALNSFTSDSVLLWAVKQIYLNNPELLVDLDFFMQEVSNRGHYHSSAFFSNPSQYLYYHIVFDEVVYEMLRTRPAKVTPPL